MKRIWKTVLANEGLVYYVMRKEFWWFVESGAMAREDMVQYGLLGLYNAVKNYNPKRLTKFSTYAYTAIKNTIGGFLRTEGFDLFRMPCYVYFANKRLTRYPKARVSVATRRAVEIMRRKMALVAEIKKGEK